MWHLDTLTLRHDLTSKMTVVSDFRKTRNGQWPYTHLGPGPLAFWEDKNNNGPSIKRPLPDPRGTMVFHLLPHKPWLLKRLHPMRLLLIQLEIRWMLYWFSDSDGSHWNDDRMAGLVAGVEARYPLPASPVIIEAHFCGFRDGMIHSNSLGRFMNHHENKWCFLAQDFR